MAEVNLLKHRTKTKEHWSSKLPSLPLLENWLLEHKKVTADQISECSEIAMEEGQNITRIMVDKGYVLERTILNFYADQLGLEYLDSFTKKTLDDLDYNKGFFNKFNLSILDNMSIIPFKYESTDNSSVVQIYQVHVILSDPWQQADIKHAVSDVIRRMNMENLNNRSEYSVGNMNSSEYEIYNEDPQIEIVAYLAKSADIRQVLQEIGDTVEIQVFADKEEAEAMRLWNEIMNGAIKMKATDIHVSPLSNRGGLWVRFRIDGEMEDRIKTSRYSREEYQVLLNKIMVEANLDTTRKAMPQSGALRHMYEKNTYDMRIEVIYTSFNNQDFEGNKVSLRILYNTSSVTMESLGLYASELELLTQMYSQPSGMLLATGPTSSGKSTTMFSILQNMDLLRRNCYTAEDPVEYHLENATQIPISEPEGRTYAVVVRSFMRLDPDILYLGEIRDGESARAAVQIANTGHTVLSTLHTNSSYSVPLRLSSMGVESYMLSSALSGVIAQRLVRKNCPHCLEEYKPDQHIMDLLELSSNERYYHGSGHTADGRLCPYCKGKGYKGRIGIFELLPLFKYPGWERHLQEPTVLRQMMMGYGYADLYMDATRKMHDQQISPNAIAGIIAPVNAGVEL